MLTEGGARKPYRKRCYTPLSDGAVSGKTVSDKTVGGEAVGAIHWRLGSGAAGRCIAGHCISGDEAQACAPGSSARGAERHRLANSCRSGRFAGSLGHLRRHDRRQTSLCAQRRPVFRAGVERKAVHDGRCAVDDSGERDLDDERRDFRNSRRQWHAERRCAAARLGRPHDVRPHLSVGRKDGAAESAAAGA